MTKSQQSAGRISYLASTIVLGIGVLVLIGWQFDIALLKTGLPGGLATMKVNTALGFVMSSVALQILARRLTSHAQKPTCFNERTQVLLLGCALLTALLGLLTLTQYAFGWDLGIDQLLFADQVTTATSHPGRMGANTAINFGLIGVALLLLNGRGSRQIWLGQLLTLASLAITVQALVGFAYDVPILYQFSVHTSSMAYHTALAFVALGWGMLALYPAQGLMQTITAKLAGGIVARQLLPAAILLPLILGWLIVQGYRAGYYEPEFAMSLLAVLLLGVQAILIWQSAHVLNRNDLRRRKIEAELRESELRFRQITESIDDVFWMADPTTGQCLYVSPHFEQIWKRSLEAVRKNWREWIDAIHPEDRQRVEHQFCNHLLNGYDEEYRIIRPDGSIRWIRDRGYPVYGNAETVQYTSGIAEDITERKQIELERDRFFSLSLDLLCIAGLDGYFRRLNPAFERILGYGEAELLHQPFIDFVHPEDRTDTLAAMEKLARGEQAIHFENRYRCKDGTYRWLDWVSVPVLEDGLLYAVAHDVTCRKQLEQQLRQSEARFRRLSDANVIGVIFANLKGNIVGANDAFLNMVGYTRAELIAGEIRWRDMTPPEYWPHDERAIAELRQRGVCSSWEKEYFRKDGQRVPILIGGALLNDASETAICFVLDLSTRKQAEAALRESEARFRYLTDTSPMLVWMSGPDKLCNYFNAGWLEFTGRSLEQEMGNGWTEGIHPDDFQRCVNTYVTAFNNRQAFEMEYRLRRFDGEYRWILDIGVPRLTLEGDFCGYIGSCVDIHDRKQAEEKTQRLNEILESRVQERTAQLEAVNKELESFCYSVSHDLRAPLRHITGFLDLLQKHLDPASLDATSQRYLTIIADTTRQAGILIDELLAFSRMGRTEMRLFKVDMNQLVQEVRQELEPEMAQRQIHWQIEPLPVVQGDPSMLRLVLRNLLENALKYSRSRAVAEICIGSKSTVQEDVLFVRDNGMGFNMQYAHKLFGIFQRLHNNPNYEGTGIGLANVQRIIHRHGGRTWAEGAIDAGATFYFSLPKLSRQPTMPLEKIEQE